jgi:hypothetical protein
VGHNFADMGAIDDHVATINPNPLACAAVVIEVQLAHKDKRGVGENLAELLAILARMLNDKLVDDAVLAVIRHIHCDHKFHV